jgi:hypothetical protein
MPEAPTYSDMRDWDRMWTHEHGGDEYTELVSTITDEVMPSALPMFEERYLRWLAAKVVLFVLHDPDMRSLLGVMWSASDACSCPDDGSLIASCVVHGALVGD